MEHGEPLAVIPNNPQRDGYSFEGWYIELECINAVDFKAFLKGNVDEETFLYTKWKE